MAPSSKSPRRSRTLPPIRCLPAPCLLAVPGLLALGASGCSRTLESTDEGLAFLQVDLLTSNDTSEEDPAPFSSETTELELRVQALDRDAALHPVSASMSLRVRPGSIEGDDDFELVDGEWTGTVGIRNGFGPTRIWASDDLEKDTSRDHTWVAGVSDALWFAYPTIPEIQSTDDHETNQLEGEYTQLRVEDREVVVTAVGTDGFWAADVTDTHGEYNGLFLYTFSRPSYGDSESEGGDEGANVSVEVGDRLSLLSGVNQEYLATTQFSFPTYEAMEGETLEVPDAVEPSNADLCDDDAMEKLESLLVRLEGASIPADFQADSSSEDYTDYVEYGQWPLETGADCTVYADSSAIPDFYPTDYAGQDLDYVQGMLSEVWGKWILVVRSESDLSAAQSQAVHRTSASLPRGRRKARSRN